ncbi:RNA 2',3'-cyclic phosphodiesterase [Indioceanicola profundi]|uniref:RNA 2',3'-cyclic phosphodiesterase n=1 Tax=Indioceanicola profundi TaxID=2220096 RepID=UPI000E6AA2FB|nr:RNA 2',3'-cyclic phosphodiesterase [Indioceanicola profundi]
MIRLFAAIPLPEAMRERLSRLNGGVPGARWVAPENMHITLRFIGEVDEGRAQDIDAALDTVTAQPFPLTLSGLGNFGRGHRAHTLWVGVEKNPALHHLRDKVESAVVRAGLPAEERKYSPHITLARLKDTNSAKLGRFLEENGMFQDGPIMVERFCLYESILGRSGPVYHEVRSYPLGGWSPGGDEAGEE